MTDVVADAFALWRDPLPEGEAGLAAFRTVYADPLRVNGADTALQVLVDRARALQGAFSGLAAEVHQRTGTDGHVAFAFSLSGRHTGPLATPIGVVPATGRDVRVAGIDIFTLRDGLVVEVWAVADYLALLADLAAVRLTSG